MEILGKPPINGFTYVTGKAAAYATWLAIPLQSFVLNLRVAEVPELLAHASLTLAAAGLAVSAASILNLGPSLRFGLPAEDTALKTAGVYGFSRNPMYLGFYAMTLSAMLYTLNPLVIACGIYGIHVHHRITLSEEEFLGKRFGREYEEYCKRVRRYL